MIKVVALILLSIVLAACVSNDSLQTSEKKQGNLPDYLDLTTRDGEHLNVKVQAMLFRKYWKAKPQTVRERVAPNAKSGCVHVLVAISEEGKMSSYGILKSYPQGVLDELAISRLKKRRWEATEFNLDKKPVLTTIKITHMYMNSSNRGEASKECEVSR